MTNNRVLAIVGMGPRGGRALQNLIQKLNQHNTLNHVKLLLFEKTKQLGNGSVYDTNQIQSNWINISERILLLDKRETIVTSTFTIPSFPSYHTWAKLNYDIISDEQIDHYPPRRKIGSYLSQRFQSLVIPLIDEKIISIFSEEVIELSVARNNKITLTTKVKTYPDIDEILLTIGHQPTQLTDQLLEWQNYSANKNNLTLFTSPYPIDSIINDRNFTHTSKIGIRGFGLAMIDVARAIANAYGSFIIEDDFTRACLYKPNNDNELRLLPFSLDGLPPVPKPINAKIDNWFKPSEKQLLEFESTIVDPAIQQNAESHDFLISAFAPIAAEIYLSLDDFYGKEKYSILDIEKIIVKCLNNNNEKHPTLLSDEADVSKLMLHFVDMATGRKAVSLDYCIGQVWRYCQPSIYKCLSFNNCKDRVFAEIISLDESTKRYSYGPPVESIQQLIALINAGVILIDLANNPEIELVDSGWRLKLNGKTMTTGIMINSVLSSPKIESVNTPLVRNMLEDDLVKAVYDDLGVSIDDNGYLQSEKDHNIPIALLGRLAKGTIIGVDAILECFGDRPKMWAGEAARRHSESLNRANNR